MFKIDGDDKVEKVFDFFIAVCGVLLLIGGNVMVFSRVLSLSVPWAEELMRNVFVWLLFFGAAFESKRGLVAVTICDDVAIKNKHAGFYKLLMIIQTSAIMLFAAFAGYYSVVQALDQLKKHVTSLTLKYPTGIFTLLVGVAFILMFIYQVILLVKRISTPKDKLMADAIEKRGSLDASDPAQ